VLANLEERMGQRPAAEWFEKVFRGGSCGDILDVRPAEQKNRLFGYKEEVWKRFNYSQAYLDGMKSQSFWDAEFDQIEGVDRALLRKRAEL